MKCCESSPELVKFCEILEQEVIKVNKFYIAKLREAYENGQVIQDQLKKHYEAMGKPFTEEQDLLLLSRRYSSKMSLTGRQSLQQDSKQFEEASDEEKGEKSENLSNEDEMELSQDDENHFTTREASPKMKQSRDSIPMKIIIADEANADSSKTTEKSMRLPSTLADKFSSAENSASNSSPSFASRIFRPSHIPFLSSSSQKKIELARRNHMDSDAPKVRDSFYDKLSRTVGLDSFDVQKKQVRRQLMEAISEYYRSLDLLRNYQILNYTAFVKAVKKFEKSMLGSVSCRQFLQKLESEAFNNSLDVKALIDSTEKIFASTFFPQSRQKAMKHLRIPEKEPSRNWSSFRLGFYLGILLPVTVLITIVAFMRSQKATYPDWDPAWIIFRGGVLPVFMLFLFGVDVFFYNLKHVNHVFIFELDARNNLSYHQIMEFAGMLALVWSLTVLLYVFESRIFISGIWAPFAFAAFLACVLFIPLNIFHRSSRYFLIRISLRCMSAPFHSVKFADFWIGDQFNSLNIMFLDWYYMICFYSTGLQIQNSCQTTSYGLRPIIQILPALWRFLQCLRRFRDTQHPFPHLVNAGKYSCTFFVTLFATLDLHQKELGNPSWNQFRTFWIICAIIGTVYTSSWDLLMDWGLFPKHPDGNRKFLRPVSLYPIWYYYFSAVLNTFLRMVWMLTIVPQQLGILKGMNMEVLITILAFCELIRRSNWNVLRLENEHLNNCGQFRAVRAVPLPYV